MPCGDGLVVELAYFLGGHKKYCYQVVIVEFFFGRVPLSIFKKSESY